MRSSLPRFIITLWMVAPIAQAQTAVTQPAATPVRESGAAHPARRTSRPATSAPKRGAPAGKTHGVLALGATDITGNKELPKVMVIVPWKGSAGADGVMKPTDSLLDEVLEPVDRGVFQRQIHYYGQLDAGAARPAGSKVAPVGDNGGK